MVTLTTMFFLISECSLSEYGKLTFDKGLFAHYIRFLLPAGKSSLELSILVGFLLTRIKNRGLGVCLLEPFIITVISLIYLIKKSNYNFCSK